MPRTSKLPKLQYHKATKRFLVQIKGKKHYLGYGDNPKKPPLDVTSHYNEAVRKLLGGEPVSIAESLEKLTVVELVVRHQEWATKRYLRSNEADCFRHAAQHLVKMFGRTPAEAFGPRRLAELRSHLEGVYRKNNGERLTRQGINKTISKIKQIFTWGVSQEIVKPDQLTALRTLPPLLEGHTTCPEANQKPPVEDSVVRTTLPFLCGQVKALVSLQRLTGMRPGEVCRLVMDHLDTSREEYWVYSMRLHKTTHHGKRRSIILGKAAIEILKLWVRSDSLPLFSPSERMNSLRESQRIDLKRDRRKKQPRKVPGVQYTTQSYGKAIVMACKANGIPEWSPNQLRKANATEVLERFDVSHASAMLGNSPKILQECYAKEDRTKAVRVAMFLSEESINWRDLSAEVSGESIE